MAANLECPKCDGTTWITVESPQGPVATRCECFGRDVRAAPYGGLGLPPRFRTATFDNFSAGSANEDRAAYNTLIAALRKAQNFAADFPVCAQKGLLFHGGSPAKMTHLAVAALKALTDRGLSCFFCDYQELLDALRPRSEPESASSARASEFRVLIAQVDVLLVDSLGAHRRTEWVADTVGGIIRSRYNHEKGLIATTNWPLERTRPAHGQEASGYQEQNVPFSEPETLEERIGSESKWRLVEHCAPVSLRVKASGSAQAPPSLPSS